MKKTVIRLYDKNDKYSLKGNCHFLVLKSSFDELSDYEFKTILDCLTMLPWQNYTSYLIGEVELSKSEEYSCEILNYTMDECCIDIARVENIEKYKLPELYRYNG